MGWLFGKSKSNKIEKDDSQWSIATAEDNGNPLIIRVRHDMPKWCGKDKYSHLLTISWPFSGPGGMPDKHTNNAQAKLEDVLDSEIEAKEIAVLTVVVTGNNTKEWQFYTEEPQSFMGVLNTVLPKDKPLPIQISMDSDPQWLAYGNFKEALQ